MTDDIFSGCEIDEIYALVFDQVGPEGLRELLAKVVLDREVLEDAAGKLKDAGLPDASKLVAESAARAQPCGITPKERAAKTEAARKYWGGGDGMQ